MYVYIDIDTERQIDYFYGKNKQETEFSYFIVLIYICKSFILKA